MPSITKNLLSISKLARDNNAFAEFFANGCVIKDKRTKRVLLQGSLNRGLYEMRLVEASPQSLSLLKSASLASCVNMNKCKNMQNKAVNQLLNSKSMTPNYNVLVATRTNSVLWHAKLGHPSPLVLKKVLNTLHFSFNVHSLDFCDSCKLGKVHRLPFQRAEITAKSPLELVYSDVWVPAPMLSGDGYRYYVVFIDAYTRYT